MDKKSIAFFGLGAMGAPMAERLLKAGYRVHTSIHHNRAAADDLAKRSGLIIFPSPAQAARDADVIITILPTDAEVKSFLMSDSLADSLKNDAVIVDMSSCTTEAIEQVEAWYAPRGISVIDAPVSGGVTGAADGTLTIFASGSKEMLQMVRPVLQVLGKNIFHVGSCGTGKAFKNLNNLLSTINVMVITEMFHVAKKRGYDMDLLFDVISSSSGASASFKNRFKRMVNNEFNGGFKQSLARKDVANAIALGKDVPMPVSKLVHELMLANSDYDDMDMSAMCKLFES